MKKLTWWMRIIGGFYTLLTLMNLYGLFINPDFFAQNLPPKYQGITLAVASFSDAWMVFVFELGVIGILLILTSRQPLQARWLVLLVIWAEVFRGVVCDTIWIYRGYDKVSYLVFIVIHLIIIITGYIYLKSATSQSINKHKI